MRRRSSVVNRTPVQDSSTANDSPNTRVTATDIDTADDTANTTLSDDNTPIAECLKCLRGVTAFVEVRTSNDNRSHAISAALRQLGASVVSKFSDDVTHVIYKEGKKRTRDKAAKKNVHLVSVLWVDSCRKNKERVCETLFPAIVPEAQSTPIPFGRLKKMKSMQPTDFADDLIGSAERCEKRRKRVATMNRFQQQEETPEVTPPAVLVHETQPRSGPMSAGGGGGHSRWGTPMSLTIPDTPPSMREKLREMKMAKLTGTSFSPLARPGDMEPLIRKLFDNEALSQEDMDAMDEDPLPPKLSTPVNGETTDDKGKKKKKLLTEPVKPSSFLVEPTHSSEEKRPGLLPSGKRILKGKKRTLADSNKSQNSGSGNKNSVYDFPTTPEMQQQPMLSNSASGPVIRLGRGRIVKDPGSGPSHRGRKRKAEENIENEETTKRNKTHSPNCPQTIRDAVETENKVPKRRRSQQNIVESEKVVPNRRRSLRGVPGHANSDVSAVDMSRTDTTLPPLSETDRSGILGASMSAVFDSTVTGFAPPRHSIDEFSVGRARGRKGRDSQLTSICENTSNVSKPKKSKAKRTQLVRPPSSSASGDDEATETSMTDVSNVENVEQKRPVKLRRANSLDKSTSVANCSISSRSRPSLVMTSLHTYEQETIISIVKKLGCFVQQDNVTETTTHVVYGDPRRTLNVLAAIARGCWLLKKEWVFKSIETGHWLNEEDFECCDKFPQAKIARQERQKQGDEYRQTLFSDCGQLFVSGKCVPPRGSLVNLLNLCGAQVSSSISRCSIHIGPEAYAGKTSVKPVWILDCIMEQKLLPVKQYQIFSAANKRESSPEF